MMDERIFPWKRHVSLLAVLVAVWPRPLFGTTLPASLDDTDADASFFGESPYDYAGRTLSGDGDVNGDGLPDLLVGAYGSDDGAGGGGETYLVLGDSTRLSGDLDLGTADASWVGTTTSEYTSLEIAITPDLDGDGYDDVLVGTYKNSEMAEEAGKVYLVYGDAASSFSTDESLTDSDAAFLGEDAYDHAGRSVVGLGDVDGDGLGDLAIAGCWNSDAGEYAGKTYVFLGRAGRFSGDQDLGDADASYLGENPVDYAGRVVADVGDVNADGYRDWMIGAYGNDDAATDAGQSYLLLGGASGWSADQDLGGADASWVGEATNDRSGLVVAGAGDVDDDGFDDVLVCAYRSDRSATDAGAVYLVRGRSSGFSTGVDLGTADAIYTGEDAYDYAGRSATGLGDLDGDGFDDLLFGATGADDGGVDAGRAYVVYGSSAPADLTLSSADTIITGHSAGSGFPYYLKRTGDLDGEGHPEIVVAGYDDSTSSTQAGVVRLFYTDDYFDDDGDGYSPAGGDCDDEDAGMSPGATEIPYDGIDQDCDGTDSYDGDGDGYDSDAYGGTDCDDDDPTVHPGSTELCLDGVDNDCEGTVDWVDEDGDGVNDCEEPCEDPHMDPDQDGDGAVREECDGNDCDDLDPEVYPGAVEIPYDGVDQDCDGADLTDVDEDGYDAEEAGGEDCDDEDPDVNPDAEEIPYNGIDDDCRDGDLDDLDGDGHAAEEAGGEDCDDEDADIHPDASEDCEDGIDNDCDGAVDDDDSDCSGTGPVDTADDPCVEGGDTGLSDTGDTAGGGSTPGEGAKGCRGCDGGTGAAPMGVVWIMLLGMLRRERVVG